MKATHILARIMTKGARDDDFKELAIIFIIWSLHFVYHQIKKRIQRGKSKR
jgi:hypothetical protein